MRTLFQSRRIWRPYALLARHYDEALGKDNFCRTRRAFEQIVRKLDISFSSAADVGCGTGLFARYLSERWRVPVFAVDRSPEMLRVAQRICPGASVCLLQQDMRNLRLPRQVDLITANFDTVNHLLCKSDLREAFRGIAGNLNPGGHFFFDVLTPCRPLPSCRTFVLRYRLRSGEVEQHLRWEPRTRSIFVRIVRRHSRFLPPYVEMHRERSYSPKEIASTLLDAGFRIRAVLDSRTLSPPTTCPPRLIVLAQKLSSKQAI
jgi:SAM-dependent methyltransferase